MSYLEVAEVNLGGCGDNIGLVDPAERDAVDLEGAGDKQEARLELLEEDSLGIPRRVRPMKLPGSSCEMGWGMDFPARR